MTPRWRRRRHDDDDTPTEQFDNDADWPDPADEPEREPVHPFRTPDDDRPGP